MAQPHGRGQYPETAFLPDWSFHTTTAAVTVDEYLQAWKPSLHVQKVPVLYFPYAVFPVKRDRSTGLLVPGLNYTNRDGLVVRNAYYWAPRDNYYVTIGLDYLQKTGWGANGEFRYLLAPRTQGVVNAYYLQDDSGSAGTSERWALSRSIGKIEMTPIPVEMVSQVLKAELKRLGYASVDAGADFTIGARLTKFEVLAPSTALYWDMNGAIEVELPVTVRDGRQQAVHYAATFTDRTYANPSQPLITKVVATCLGNLGTKVREGP